MTTKFCNCCKQELPLTSFCKNSKAKDGYQWYCKGCKNHQRNGTVTRQVETARRRASKVQAQPKWADVAAITAIYTIKKRLQELTGQEYHVDHIDPLQHELVCGLHVPANLQAIPASVNLGKSNHFTPYRIKDGVTYALLDGEWC